MGCSIGVLVLLGSAGASATHGGTRYGQWWKAVSWVEQAADLEADNAQLRQDAVKLKGDLREANETLEAARAMAEINRPGQREDAPPAPTTSRPQRSRRSPSPV
jgi:hypothetical protein